MLILTTQIMKSARRTVQENIKRNTETCIAFSSTCIRKNEFLIFCVLKTNTKHILQVEFDLRLQLSSNINPKSPIYLQIMQHQSSH